MGGIVVCPQDPKTMYCALSIAAASKDGGVYRSQDAGKTWMRFDKVQVHGTIMSVGLHHTDPNQVYIGARYQGEIFGTQDGGESWTSIACRRPSKTSTASPVADKLGGTLISPEPSARLSVHKKDREERSCLPKRMP